MKITAEEFKALCELKKSITESLIGTREALEADLKSKGYDKYSILNAVDSYRKMQDKIWKMVELYGDKARCMILIGTDSVKRGSTAAGEPVTWIINHGWTARSRFCGQLQVSGKTVFTSGTPAAAIEYMMTH